STLWDALPMASTNWDLFTLTIAHVRVGWTHSDRALDAAARLRESVDPEFYLRQLDAAATLDATPYLQDVRSPTLVLCRRLYQKFELQASRRLAEQIPTARLVVLDGSSNELNDGADNAIARVEEFLEHPTFSDEERPRISRRREPRSLTSRELEILEYL